MIKTTTLETSKLLKEAGFPQEDSHRYWHTNKHGHPPVICQYSVNHFGITDVEIYAAPTAEEILDRLPKYLTDGEIYCLVILYGEYQGKSGYGITYMNFFHQEDHPAFMNDFIAEESVAEVAGKTYLYLVNQGLLSRQEK